MNKEEKQKARQQAKEERREARRELKIWNAFVARMKKLGAWIEEEQTVQQ